MRTCAELVAQKKLGHLAAFEHLLAELDRDLGQLLASPAAAERVKTDPDAAQAYILSCYIFSCIQTCIRTCMHTYICMNTDPNAAQALTYFHKDVMVEVRAVLKAHEALDAAR